MSEKLPADREGTIQFGCEKCHQYILGKRLIIESDHKPLETIFKKPIHNAPARLQRILLNVHQYAPTIVYVKGANLHLADMLSRDAYCNEKPSEADSVSVNAILSISYTAHQRYRMATAADLKLQSLIPYIVDGWPDDSQALPVSVIPFCKVPRVYFCVI